MLAIKSLSFITNNAEGIQSSKKRLKLIQYFKGKIGSTGVLFLQETHSHSKIEQKWKEDFKGQVETNKEGRILILDVSINDFEYTLINLYNANPEKEQIDILNNMFVLLEKLDTNPKKQLIMAGDFNLFLDPKLDAQGGNPTIKKNSLA